MLWNCPEWKFKGTSKSQQVFQVCSASQAMSGFGGRSCFEWNDSTWAILLTSFLILIVQKSSGCTFARFPLTSPPSEYSSQVVYYLYRVYHWSVCAATWRMYLLRVNLTLSKLPLPLRKKFHSASEISSLWRIISPHSMNENTSLSFSNRPLSQEEKSWSLNWWFFVPSFLLILWVFFYYEQQKQKQRQEQQSTYRATFV